ncbi:MAG: hypothetical protein ACSLFD_10165 [Solirubrobacterales bacterium]
MNKTTKTLTALFAVVGMVITSAAPAMAANETASVDLTMRPQSKLFKQVANPVNWRADVEVKALASSPQILPLKRVKIRLPRDMKFVPKRTTPVCPNSSIGPEANLNFDPNTIIARCPGSVLGNGTAGLYLANNNSPTGSTLTDPVLVVFNGGKNSAGLPKIKIYGYSGGTGVGIYMEGVLNKSVLTVSIPRLSFDSAVGDFNLNIPGTNSPFANRRGKDRTYVQSRCSRGFWVTTAGFTLGTRDSAGNAISPDSFIAAPTARTDCTGLNGRPRLGPVKIKGPNKTRRGGSKVYRVRVKNSGTAVARAVTIKTGGKWVKSTRKFAGKIFPRTAKTVKVRVRLTGKARRGKATAVKFRINAKNATAKTVKKQVRVR